MRVIKISGHQMADEQFLDSFAAAIAALSGPIVIVHGGGQAILDLQSYYGLETVKVDGLRVTDAATMNVVEMALSAQVNKRIVRALLRAGIDAIGLSGIDGGLLRCSKKLHPSADLGFVGEIESVRTPFLQQLLDQGIVPIISPVSLGPDGNAFNVNADEGGMAVAAALKAQRLDFVSNVPGVLHDMTDENVISMLSVAETHALIQDGTIQGGMIPKVKAALEAIEKGVAEARIVDLAGLATGAGTVFQSATTVAVA